jgi:hypothetical protein
MKETEPNQDYQNPVFIVGMPRSGTTLIQGILCNTGFYFPIPETHFFSRIGYGLPERLGDSDKKEIYQLLRKKSRIEVDKKAIYKLNTQKEIFEYIIEAFNYEKIDTFLEKTPRHVFFYSNILNYYPSAKFICMIREPKNVVSSQKINSRMKNKSIIRMAFLYNKIAGAIIRIKDKNNVLLIKYEDLTAEIEKTIKNTFRFLEIPYSEAVIEKVAAPSEIVQEHEFWKKRNIEGETIQKNDPEKWQMGLSLGQAELVNLVTKNYAKKFDYELNYNHIRACYSFIRDMPNLSSHREIQRLFSKIHG